MGAELQTALIELCDVNFQRQNIPVNMRTVKLILSLHDIFLQTLQVGIHQDHRLPGIVENLGRVFCQQGDVACSKQVGVLGLGIVQRA